MSKTLRVAIDARMIRHSGIGVVLRRLLQAWGSMEGAPEFLLCGQPTLLKPEIPGGLCATIHPWDAPVYSPRAALFPPDIRGGYDVWYAPHYATCLRPQAPLVCHIQDLLHLTHSSRPATGIFLKVHLEVLKRRAVYTLVTTRHVKTQLQTLHGFNPQKTLLTGLGAGEVEDFLEVPPKDSETPYLFATGIYKPHKNWTFLLKRLAREEWKEYDLWCGGVGMGAAALKAAARRAGFSLERLRILEEMPPEELASIHKGARALVYPSLAEGFGLPLLEALTLGVPVVHANLSPMKEIAGGSGYAFDPDWPESFDDALKRALTGQRPVPFSTVYTWRKTADVVLSVIRAAAEGTCPKPSFYCS